MTEQLIELNEDFFSQYIGKQPKWGFGGLGYIVYLRTYSRKKADGTLETWPETVRRFTEGNFNIEADRLMELGKWTQGRKAQLTEEMERFFHLAFNLVILPPGRGMWMSGTEYAKKVGDAENNCWSVSMRPQSYGTEGGAITEPKVSFAPVFTFDQAMKGGGVGVNVQRQYVDQVPNVSNDVQITFGCEGSHKDFETELESMGVRKTGNGYRGFAQDRGLGLYGKMFSVPDSREGWAEALGKVIDAHYEGIKHIELDLSDIRPRGSEIKGFGGVASGPAPLVKMLTKVNEILNRRVDDYVTPTEWGDVIQLIGTCVVAGNVRRTALILIGDHDDKEFVESKDYRQERNQEASQWRWASNNSVDIKADTDRDTLRQMASNIYFNGEPGYVSTELARNYGRIVDGYREGVDGEVEGFNPCGEITLPNASPCNLFEINLPRVHELTEREGEDDTLYEEVAYLAARYAYRITFRTYEWAATRDIVERHRRLGVGITGITDWVLEKFGNKAIDSSYDGVPRFVGEVADALDELYGHVEWTNKAQAVDLDANPSIKITTVKPSGTVSILMGVSPGQHFHWSPYMIRRIRMSADAPLVDVLLRCGYYVEPAIQGFNADGSNVYDYNTVVVDFPVKAPTAESPKFQSAGEVPLKEQAALQAMLATYWSDNAVSATLSFKQAEPKPVFFEDGTVYRDKFGSPKLEIDPRDEDRIIGEITDVLDRYKGTVKSTSLLPHATGTYPQMPYEEITEEEYERMAAKITAKPWELMGETIDARNATGEDEDDDVVGECSSGGCPLK